MVRRGAYGWLLPAPVPKLRQSGWLRWPVPEGVEPEEITITDVAAGLRVSQLDCGALALYQETEDMTMINVRQTPIEYRQ